MAKAVVSELTFPSRANACESQGAISAPLPAEKERAEIAPSVPVDLPTFTVIFQRYAPYVLHALPYLGVAEADCEDLCQEVFTTVYVNFSKFQGRSSIRTWIYGICLNKVLNYRRVAHRRRERFGAITEQESDCNQLHELEQQRTRSVLSEALAALSDEKRQVFVLYEIEELSMPEVAQTLGCPLFTAYSRLYAARRDIKAAVERLSAEDQDPPRRASL